MGVESVSPVGIIMGGSGGGVWGVPIFKSPPDGGLGAESPVGVQGAKPPAPYRSPLIVLLNCSLCGNNHGGSGGILPPSGGLGAEPPMGVQGAKPPASYRSKLKY